MHALNAYFGRRHFDPAAFRLLCEDYDRAAGQPPGTSVVSAAAGFFGELGRVVVRERELVLGPGGETLFESDGSAKTRATRVTHQIVGGILHHALARAGNLFDEAIAVSAAYESPGTRRTGRTSARPPGAWTRPRLDPARLAAQGVRAVFVFDPGHIWIWRHAPEGGAPGDLGWCRIDSMRAGGAPQGGDPSGEWNGAHGIAVAVPRSYRKGEPQ